MELHKVFNASEIGKILTKGGKSIRTNRIPGKYQYQVKELNDFIEQWISKYGFDDSKVEIKTLVSSYDVSPSFEKIMVKEGDKQGIFKSVSGEPNIYTNTICYQVKKFVSGSFVESYYYDLDDAKEFRDSLK